MHASSLEKGQTPAVHTSPLIEIAVLPKITDDLTPKQWLANLKATTQRILPS